MVTPREKFTAKKQTPEEYFRSEIFNINPEIGRRIPKLDLAEKVLNCRDLLERWLPVQRDGGG